MRKTSCAGKVIETGGSWSKLIFPASAGNGRIRALPPIGNGRHLACRIWWHFLRMAKKA